VPLWKPHDGPVGASAKAGVWGGAPREDPMHEFTYRFCPACGAPLELRLLRPGEPARPVCAACGFIHYANPKVAVGTIIEADDSVARVRDLDGAGTGQRPVPPCERPVPPRGAPGLILVRRAIEPGYGRWVFPGGFVDRGEPLEAAAIREAREETGLDVRLDALVNVYSYAGAPVVVIADPVGRAGVRQHARRAARLPGRPEAPHPQHGTEIVIPVTRLCAELAARLRQGYCGLAEARRAEAVRPAWQAGRDVRRCWHRVCTLGLEARASRPRLCRAVARDAVTAPEPQAAGSEP